MPPCYESMSSVIFWINPVAVDSDSIPTLCAALIPAIWVNNLYFFNSSVLLSTCYLHDNCVNRDTDKSGTNNEEIITISYQFHV